MTLLHSFAIVSYFLLFTYSITNLETLCRFRPFLCTSRWYVFSDLVPVTFVYAEALYNI